MRENLTPLHWDRLCIAKMNYASGADRGTWWRELRRIGYRPGSHMKAQLEREIDQWLTAHPSWTKHQQRKCS